MKLSDVKEYYQKIFRPDLTTIVVIGNISAKDAVASFEKYFGDWRATGSKPKTDYEPGKSNGTSTIFVPDKQRLQDDVTLKEVLTLTRSNPDYYPLQVGVAVISGGFYATRLSKELREKRGLVYSVEASLASDKTYSEFAISYGTSAKNVFSVRSIIERIIGDMIQNPIPVSELEQAKNILVNQMILSKTSYTDIAGELLERAMLDLPLNEQETAMRVINQTTPGQVKAAFGKWIRPKDLVLVSRGPRPH